MSAKILTIDSSSSEAAFSVKKVGFITVKGTLSDFSGQITFDKEDVENSSFEVSVNTNTIKTDSAKRDEHLRNQDFFDVDNYPNISFKSTSIQSSGTQFKALGNLTILQTTKSIEIPFDYNNGVFSGNFFINRLDYGLGKKFPSLIVGKTIQISISCKTK